nr:MAG TPA: DNA polymerase B [Caudoviricetes sp.]
MIGCLVNFNNTKAIVKAYTQEDFPYYRIKKSNPLIQPTKQYIEHLMTFDIETTTIEKTDGTFEGFMFHWQVCIDGYVCFGRTWKEFLTFLRKMNRALKNYDEKHKLICYIHNFSYEFQFLYSWIKLENVFAIDKRKPLKAISKDFNIEFRCSYLLSNMNLKKFIENTPNAHYFKGSGDLDYKKVFTPKTLLSMSELGYCYNDVMGLYEAIIYLLKEDTLTTIPLTSTGYVRRECRNNMRKNKKNRKQFLDLKLDDKLYQLCKDAFRGGNTASNRYKTNFINYDVSSYDMSSAYPYAMISGLYPITPFQEETITSLDMLDDYNNRYCTLAYYSFENVKLKKGIPFPYIPYSKCIEFIAPSYDTQFKGKEYCYNGRVLEANFIKIAMTNYDYQIFINQYEYDEENVRVEDFYYSHKGFLPKELINTVLEFFTLKSQLKGIDGKEYEYMKSKNKLNSLYGMIVTDIIRQENLFNDQWEKGENSTLEEYYSKRNNFLTYQWGLFVTAICRTNLQKAIDKIGLDCVYIDTDSLKYCGSHDEVFEHINQEMIDWCLQNDIINYVEVGNHKYFLGLFDKEKGYDEFVTLGAKKYAFNQNGQIGITVAGLNKKSGAQELERKGGLSIFKIGIEFFDSGRKTVYYNDDKKHFLTVQGCQIENASNIALVDTTYTLGMTDVMLSILNGLESED